MRKIWFRIIEDEQNNKQVRLDGSEKSVQAVVDANHQHFHIVGRLDAYSNKGM